MDIGIERTEKEWLDIIKVLRLAGRDLAANRLKFQVDEQVEMHNQAAAQMTEVKRQQEWQAGVAQKYRKLVAANTERDGGHWTQEEGFGPMVHVDNYRVQIYLNGLLYIRQQYRKPRSNYLGWRFVAADRVPKVVDKAHKLVAEAPRTPTLAQFQNQEATA